MPANVQTEINALSRLMSVKDPELLVKIDPDMFGSEDLRNLYNLIKRFFTEKGTWIGWDVLNGIVSKAARSQERAAYVLKLVQKIRDRDTAGLTDEDMLTELNEFKSLRTVMDVSEELLAAVEQKDATKVVALYKQGYEKLCFASAAEEESDIGMLSKDDTATVFRKTGIEPIDARSGFAEGALVLLGGESGTGKSTLAHCIGIHNYLNYPGSVGYWTFEQGKREISSRIWSRTSQVDLGNIISGKLSPEERKVLRQTKADFLFEGVDGNLLSAIDQYKDRSETEYMNHLYKTYAPRANKFQIFDDCPDFDSLLLKMELMYSMKNTRVFIIDYITLIPRGRLYRELAQWEYNLYKSAALKTFARRHGDAIVITPVQYNSKEDTIRLASNMINDADIFLAMKQTEEDAKCDIVTTVFKKYRNFTGEALKDFQLLKDFSKAGFIYVNM